MPPGLDDLDPADTARVESLVAVLDSGELEVVGQLLEASNLALLVQVCRADAEPVKAIYKPVQGERPLWDFPTGTLAGREVATYLISQAGGWGLVPPTTLREGPLGTGSVQAWITHGAPEAEPVDLVPAGTVPPGTLAVFHAESADGADVAIVHRDLPELASLAVLDCVVNNADRKGSHLLTDPSGRIWAFDHGVTLHAEDKLRTVLWGWAGQALPGDEVTRLERLQHALDDGLLVELTALLDGRELGALVARVDRLLRRRRFPDPDDTRFVLPWPPL